jgi:hypothetical protein
MPTLTFKEYQKLVESGRVCMLYPRKLVVCVDGFKYYKVTAAVAFMIKSTAASV